MAFRMTGRRILYNGVFKRLNDENFQFFTPWEKKQLSFLLVWLNKIFNAVDRKRLELLGADLTCAEWLLRNGAGVRFKGQPALLTDYNELMRLEEMEESRGYRVEEIYANDSGLSSIGFEHLNGCKYVKKITFILCQKLNTDCLNKLNYVKDSLEYLKIKACFNVTNEGLLTLMQLRNLNTLILENLPSVKEKEDCETTLKRALTNCQITFDRF